MKKLIGLLLVLLYYTSVKAQCDKNFRITASKVDFYDSTGKQEKTKDEQSSIDITGQDIKITPADPDELMTGKIKSVTCNWKTPYKEGKTVIRTDLENAKGQTYTATITMEGKDGKLTVTMMADAFPNRIIRLNMDSFQEK